MELKGSDERKGGRVKKGYMKTKEERKIRNVQRSNLLAFQVISYC